MSYARKMATTGAEAFWYVVMNIAFGAAYFGKVPIKRALYDYGLAEPTAAERFWYVVQNVFFGSGYFAKVIASKALSDMMTQNPGVAALPANAAVQ